LLPHDAKGPSLDNVVVQGFEGTLGVLSAGKVDVGIAKGHTGNVVTKHTDGVDGADDGEDFEEMLFANILVEVADSLVTLTFWASASVTLDSVSDSS